MKKETNKEPLVNYYVAECMEFQNLGEKYVNIPSMEKAIEVFKNIPESKHNMGNGIGISIDDSEWSLYENGDIDNLEYYPKEIRENETVLSSVQILKNELDKTEKAKAKALDIEPQTGDMLLNWNKNKISQKDELSNSKAIEDSYFENQKQAKSLDIEPQTGDVLLNWDKNKRSPRIDKESVKEEVNKSEKSKDDNFMKEYLEKQKRRSLAKEHRKDLGIER